MIDHLFPVVVVHGVGSGENRDRARFSLKLSEQVHEPARPVVRVGLHEHAPPEPLPDNSVFWEEALWESENDLADKLTAAILTVAVPNAPAAWLAAKALDLLGDVPLYLGPQGSRIREVVRAVIAKHRNCIVVGHSLGSVIAANILREAQEADNFQSLPVSGFVTIGSPLAILNPRTPITMKFPFPWRNVYYPTDPICLGKGLAASRFPGVSNHALSAGETFAVAHTSYWSSTVLAGIVYRLSMKGS